MNRHQSNPFLAGWEEAEDNATNAAAIIAQVQNVFDSQVAELDAADAAKLQQESSNQTRRHSSGQADVTGVTDSSTGVQRTHADRRLYLRNMSSFEAASLTLKQQELMKENGLAGDAKGVSLTGEQTDLIAKMTADFQSAIETNDKKYSAQQLDGMGDAVEGFNPFDPFETITDDDVSLPSPSTKTKQTAESTGTDKRPIDLDVEPQASQGFGTKAHDSIDDDEEELVSTPVRNIKSSPLSGTGGEHQEEDKRESPSLAGEKQTGGTADEADSIAKAEMFASLLAEAEPASSVPANDKENDATVANQLDNSQDQSSAVATHVIKGSPQSAGATGERPVGFFDPFETVIDKDALTSLMNTSDLTTGSGKSTDTPTLGSGGSGGSQASRSPPGPIAESASIETVIENKAAMRRDSSQCQSSGSNEFGDKSNNLNQESAPTTDTPTITMNASAVPRPQVSSSTTSSSSKQQQSTMQTFTQSTPRQRPKKAQKTKKPSFQEDSSDSDEEDDRIQIVIKARDVAKATETESADGQPAAPALVPLLPPPPSKSSMRQARERGQVEDMPSPIMSYKTRAERLNKRRNSNGDRDQDDGSDWSDEGDQKLDAKKADDESSISKTKQDDELDREAESEEDNDDDGGAFVIPMAKDLDDETGEYVRPDTPLYDDDTSYVLEEYPAKYEGDGWEMMLRYPPKKKLTSNRFWKKIYVRLAQVPLAPTDAKKPVAVTQQPDQTQQPPQTCIALQIFDKPEDKKPMQEIPIQATYTVSDISSQQFDQFGKIFTIKLQYIFYKERVGVRQGQLARFIHTGHIGSSTTSGGHGVDPISIGAIKRIGAPIEHSPQISQIIKLGCVNYEDIKQFKCCLEDNLFKIPIYRDRSLSTYKTEEVQMAVRDETYIELNQIGQIIRQLARVRLFFLSFLNGMPTVEVGINEIHRQGREVVGRMDILPVVTEEWIRLEQWELHPAIEKEEFENEDSRLIRLVPPDATFFELMRFRVRPPRNRELPLQISSNMSVTRTKVSINVDVMVPGEVSRRHGQIPCENIAIRVQIPECWIYFFREEKHFRMGSKKSVNRRPGKVKGIERFLGGGGGLQDFNDDSSLIEVTSGQAKYEHHHHAIVWRATRWPKETQSAYVQNTMKIRLPLTAYDQMPDSFCEYLHVEYTMPATTVSHTTLRSISINPCDDEPPEKYVKYSAKYEYKVKMRLSVNLGSKQLDTGDQPPEASPIVIMKQPDRDGDLQREEDSDDDDDDEDDDDRGKD